MDPRNITNQPWTALPQEFAFKALSALEKEFPEQASRGEFFVEGKIYPAELLIRIGHLEKGRLRQMNFEASLDYQPEKSDAIEGLYLCIDCLGAWMRDTFKLAQEDADLDLPLAWRPSTFQGQTIYLQFSSVNSRLEAEADRLLGLANDNLFVEPSEEPDALEAATVDPDLNSPLESDPNLH